MEKTRQSKFRRSRIEVPITLLERDIVILSALARYRFLTSRHLATLTQTNNLNSLNRRLRQLFDASYIDRPKAQIHSRAYQDERPMVYALGNAGASFLSNRFQMRLFDGYWTEKNNRVKEKFVEHTLGIADFMVSIEDDLRDHERYRLIREDEIIAAAPQRTKRAREPLAWPTVIRWNYETLQLSIVPDALFGIEDRERPVGKNKTFFFVEIDRGTMPILRKDVRQTSFLRKMYSYADTNSRKLHSERFGFNGFRVLTITTSQERIRTMQAAYGSEIRDLAKPGLFLFGDKEQLRNAGVMQIDWKNAEAKPASLV